MAYPQDELWYTDDTQMAIGVAEALIERGQIEEESLCRAFVANYVPSRGYGRGARAVLEAMEEGNDYRSVAETYFPGGSYGNGAAMRVAPVGLFFRVDRGSLWEQARRSALPTHLHPFGIEGAQLLALAVAFATREEPYERDRFLELLLSACRTAEYREKLLLVTSVHGPEDLAALGNRIEAIHSVPTAIASFLLTPSSFEETIANVILLGGDTDTLAAMAGAISGAHLGANRLPPRLLDLLESSPKGRDYLRGLAGQLFQAYRRRSLA
jgi:poly(ADP-ribose) glycohydrolase ARH3